MAILDQVTQLLSERMVPETGRLVMYRSCTETASPLCADAYRNPSIYVSLDFRRCRTLAVRCLRFSTMASRRENHSLRRAPTRIHPCNNLTISYLVGFELGRSFREPHH